MTPSWCSLGLDLLLHGLTSWFNAMQSTKSGGEFGLKDSAQSLPCIHMFKCGKSH